MRKNGVPLLASGIVVSIVTALLVSVAAPPAVAAAPKARETAVAGTPGPDQPTGTPVSAPVLMSPPDGAIGTRLELSWSLGYTLGEDEWAEVQVWPDREGAQPNAYGWFKESLVVVTGAHLLPGPYRWRVVAVQGRDTRRGAELGASSEEGTFIVVRPSTKAKISITPPAMPTRVPTPMSTPTTSALALSADLEVEMVAVPDVEFTLGSSRSDPNRQPNEQPLRSVALDAYYVSRTEVTVGQYRAFVEATDYNADARSLADTDDRPVRYVSWYDAVTYCDWVSETTGCNTRLPTEAEWEQAARGTDARLYPWGSAAPDDTLCNYNGVVGDTRDVGSYSPKGDSYYGCADMAGNVREWVRDYYVEFAYANLAELNPSGPQEGEKRVVRGGGWTDPATGVRAAARIGLLPGERLKDLGFRVSVCACAWPDCSLMATPTAVETARVRGPIPTVIVPTPTGTPGAYAEPVATLTPVG